MNIYELTGQYKLLETACLLNPDDEDLQAEFAKINDDIKVKADNYAKLIKNLEAEAEGYANEAKRLQDREKTIKNNVKALKANLLWSMKETGEEKFKTDLFAFSVAKNGGKQPLTLDVAVTDLPEELQKVTIEADNDKIRKYIEETGDLSYAHLEDRGEHLSIR